MPHLSVRMGWAYKLHTEDSDHASKLNYWIFVKV